MCVCVCEREYANSFENNEFQNAMRAREVKVRKQHPTEKE